MLADPRTVELTRAFYDWELRGRGWTTYPYAVVLEPPFRPFLGHWLPSGPRLDDARRHTWLSSLVESLRGKQLGAPLEPQEVEEPQPEPDSRLGKAPFLDEFVVALPEDARVPRAALLTWLRSLSSASGRISLELLGAGRRVEIRLALAQREAAHVLGQLRATLPPAVVLPAQPTLEERWCDSPGRFFAVEFGLGCEFMVPLAASRPTEEPLLPVIAALADIEADELGLLQVLFEETRQPWAESVLRSVVTPRGEPFFADAPEITALAKEKLSSPLFAVAVRIAGSAPDSDRAWEIVRRVAGGLSQFGSPRMNELIPLPQGDTQEIEGDLLDRTTHRSGMLLSAEELVSLVQLPGPGVRVPELWRARERTKKAPVEVAGSGCLLGRNEHQGEATEVRLSVEAKTKHVHVVGASGTGKSTLLVRMIVEDIEAGHGVGVLDPHGDLVEEVAARIPDGRLADVVLFDPADDEAVVGWNILGAESEVEKDLLASDLVGVFRRLSTSWGDQMTAVLANAILVFLESERGGTLVDLRQFLIDERFRKEMLETLPDPHARSFWETEFPLLIGKRPQAPILTRLDMFLRSKLIRRVVTVREPKLDFRDVTGRGLIFLGNLAMGAIGEDNAALLGSLLVSKFHQVTLARGSQAVDARRPFFLYIDEFHHVATASMASLFSGVRKYRLGLTVAHQDLYQLHASVPEVERSLIGNAYTRICFKVGEEDARQLARGLSFFTDEDLMRLGVGEAICRVGGRDGDFNLRVDRLSPLDPEDARRRRGVIRKLSAERWGTAASGDGAAPTASRPAPGATAPPPEPPKPPPPERATAPAPPPTEPTAPEPTTDEPAAGPQLDKTSLDYLELVAREPFLAVRERNEALGLSAGKGQRIKARLVDEGLVREVTVNPGGRGELFKLLEFTQAGRDLLSGFGVKLAAGHGRGGIVHQWWVNTIALWLRDRGVTAAVEDASRGARVDLSFTADGTLTAVEIEMTDGHALENIRKDLAASFSRVVCLLDDPAAVDRVRTKLSSEGSEPTGVIIGEFRDYEALLAPLLHPHPPPLRGPKQNEEPRARRRPRRRAPAAAPRPADPGRLFDPGALSTPVAADYLGLSPATLETMRTRGGGPQFVKLGRRVVYRREDLDAWLAASRRTSTSDDGLSPS